MADRKGTPWTRRAKVPLYDIDRALLQQSVRNDLVPELRISGVAKAGGPACATVPLVGDVRVVPVAEP